MATDGNSKTRSTLKGALEVSTPCPAKAGDVLFFSYLTVHGSGVSDEARTMLLVRLRDPGDPPAN